MATDEPPNTEVKKKKKKLKTKENVPLIEKKNNENAAEKKASSLDQLLHEAVESNLSQKPKKTKRKEAEMLNSLRNSGELQKETDDATLLKNTYDPQKEEDKVSRRKSKQKAIDAESFNTNEDEIEKGKRKQRRRKTIEASQSGSQSNLHEPATQTIEHETTEKPRRRKKKNESNEAIEMQEVPSNTEMSKERRKKKRNKDDGQDLASAGPSEAPSEAEPPQEPEPEPEFHKEVPDDGRIVSITIHRTDKLKTDFYISHPVVRVHVVDSATGSYLKKYTKSILPVWEEPLIFNENYNYIIDEDTKALLLFEVLDFMKPNAARTNNMSVDGGWYRIAWAFLRVRGANGQVNIDRKARLQLFQPPVRFRPKNGPLEASRSPYPSTLYLTVKGILPPAEGDIQPAARSMFATQRETGRATFDELQDGRDASHPSTTVRREASIWARFPGQMCKPPNKQLLRLNGGAKGCYVVRFSNDGRYLACGGCDLTGYPINVYEIPSGQLKGKLRGHHSMIYDLCWSRDNSSLLSASSDATASIWDVNTMSPTPVRTLPHPSFVYSALYHVRVQKVVVTAGFDRVIRVWSLQTEGTSGELMMELPGHSSYVNVLAFDPDGGKLYSGDNGGNLRIWNVYTTDQPSKRGVLRDWTLFKQLEPKEIESDGHPITNILVHPSGRRVILHVRSRGLRMLDLRLTRVMHRYISSVNIKERVRSTMSPCGSFIVAGSEDGLVYLWSVDTADLVTVYRDTGYKSSVSDVHFHPQDNLLVMCGLGENHSVWVYTHDPLVAKQEAGLSPRVIEPKAATNQDATGLDKAMNDFESSRADAVSAGTARMTRVRQMLNSVTAFGGISDQADVMPLASPGRTLVSPTPLLGSSGTWGLASASSPVQQLRAQSPPPGVLSPHAKPTPSNTLQQQQLTEQMSYMRDVEERRRSPVRGRSPHMSMTLDKGKAQFTIQGSQGTDNPQVVCLYDYAAARSDELSIKRGDVITVLHKDNVNWWWGQLASGTQGFFPVNYVTQVGDDAAVENLYDADVAKQHSEDETEVHTAAVVDKAGELQFISSNVEGKGKKPKSSGKSKKLKKQSRSAESIA